MKTNQGLIQLKSVMRPILAIRMKQHHAATILAAACLILAPSVYAADSGTYKDSPFYKGLHPNVSTNTQIVSVRFGDTIYDIPQNYLAGVTRPTAANSYAAFTIQVLLPDFSPRTPENAVRFNELGWHDQFRALFEYGMHPRTAKELLDFYLHLSKMTEDDFRIVGSNYKLYERPDNVPHEIYTKETPNGLLFFTCENDKYYQYNISPDCTVDEYFGNNIGVIYHFSRKYMDLASEIDVWLHDLMKSFERK